MSTRISYNGMSRLTAAAYLENGKLNNHFSTSYKYDLMGNILTLRREGLLDSGDYGTIDDLTYSYEGNQVVKIDDAADESPNYSGAMHFRDAANEETEYTYDANGNMLTDSNKGITSIDYNVLDLPQCINIKPNVLGNSDNKVCYTYSADGTKLRSTYKNGDSQVLPYKPTPSSNIKTNGMVTPTVKTFESNYHYCSNLVYNNDRLSTILFDGGYASVDESGGIVMHFYVKDHLGSNRLVVDGNGNIEEVNHYYPFGALMGDRCGVSRNKYKYIGKELDTMYGWNMQDHEARWYDPVLGRWMVTDPLQEKYFDSSLYCYTGNNPIRFSDPNGQDWWDKVIGFGAAIADNATGGLTNIRTYAGRNVSDPKDFNTGLTTGDLASLTVGSIESGTGATMVASGTTITTVGLVAEGPSSGTSTVVVVAGGAVLKTGVVLTAHGAVMMANAGKNLANKKGHINANSSNSTQKSSQPKNTGKNTVIFTQGKGSKATRIKTPIPDGYRKIKGFSHGITVYTNGKNYITPDVDGHNGGIWKMGKSVKALQQRHTRMGTYNAILKRIGD